MPIRQARYPAARRSIASGWVSALSPRSCTDPHVQQPLAKKNCDSSSCQSEERSSSKGGIRMAKEMTETKLPVRRRTELEPWRFSDVDRMFERALGDFWSPTFGRLLRPDFWRVRPMTV